MDNGVRMPAFVETTRVNGRSQRIGRYVCSCGREFEAAEHSVKSGKTKSCGCLKASLVSRAVTSHSESRPKTPEYAAWAEMKSRCNNPRHTSYPRYGGAGVAVCPEWSDSYETFLAHVGRKPSPEHSLDRFPNQAGNYEPGNVRWATNQEQARNRRSNRQIEFGGRTQCLQAWAEELGIKQSTLIERLEKWPLSRALTASKAESKK